MCLPRRMTSTTADPATTSASCLARWAKQMQTSSSRTRRRERPAIPLELSARRTRRLRRAHRVSRVRMALETRRRRGTQRTRSTCTCWRVRRPTISSQFGGRGPVRVWNGRWVLARERRRPGRTEANACVETTRATRPFKAAAAGGKS